MAIDTHDKKAAAMAAGLPWIMITPIADGTIDAADRAIMAHTYPMSFGLPVAAPSAETMFGMMRMVRFVKMKLMPYGSMYIE